MKKITSTLIFILSLCIAFAQQIDVPKEQKSLVTKLTATWCPVCGASAWDTYRSLLDKVEGPAVVVAAHYSSSSDLHSTAAYELIRGYNGSPSGQPIFYFNRDRVSSSVEEKVTKMVNDALVVEPLAQTGIRMEYDPNKRELVARTRTEFFKSADGEYYLSTLLVEEEVTANQAGRGSNVIHKRIIRQALTSETLGEMIASGTINSGATFDLTASIAMNSIVDAQKYQVVTILWKKTGDSREFVNTNYQDQFDPFTTPSFAVEAQRPVSILVQPNPMAIQTTVRISGAKALGTFQLNLYAATGQLMKSWQENDFSGSELNLQLDRQTLPQAGVYFLQMISEQGIRNEKIVVR